MGKRHYLSIKAEYMSNWGRFEAIRELVQNGRDAEVQDEAPFRFEHIHRIRNGKKIGCLIVENKGTTIPHQALLIGHTTKAFDNRTIGMFGEGLKFGCLAGLRNGMDIKIRNGGEVWIPVISWSDTFQCDVLAFDVTTGHKYQNRVSIEILGIEEDEWNDMKKKFLFLKETLFDFDMSIEMDSGEVLIKPEYKGCIYVKGMYVGKREDLSFGYNLNNADIDRDRRMVSDIYSYTSKLLSEALNKGQLVAKIYSLLAENSSETKYVHSYALTDNAKGKITETFQQVYPDTVPTESYEQIQELSHYGAKGVEIGYTLRTILNEKLGLASDKIKNLRVSAQHQYSFDDLNKDERKNIDDAINLVSRALECCGMQPLKDGEVNVVDFGNPSLHGTYNPNNNNIRLARKILGKAGATVRVLIHEAAHRNGPDGHKNHESTQGNLWESVYEIIS